MKPQGHQRIKISLIMLKQTHLLSHSPSAHQTSAVCGPFENDEAKNITVNFPTSTFGNKSLLIICFRQHGNCTMLFLHLLFWILIFNMLSSADSHSCTQKVQTNNGCILNWVTSFSKAWVWKISNLQSKMIAYLMLAHTIYLYVPICFLCMTDVKT